MISTKKNPDTGYYHHNTYMFHFRNNITRNTTPPPADGGPIGEFFNTTCPEKGDRLLLGIGIGFCSWFLPGLGLVMWKALGQRHYSEFLSYNIQK